MSRPDPTSTTSMPDLGQSETSDPCGYCGQVEADEPRQQCLDCHGKSFHCEAEADAHARLTGHSTGWPITSADWKAVRAVADMLDTKPLGLDEGDLALVARLRRALGDE